MARRPAVLMYLIAAEAEAHAKRRQCIKIRSRRCLRRRGRDCLPREEFQITARRAADLYGRLDADQGQDHADRSVLYAQSMMRPDDIGGGHANVLTGDSAVHELL